MTTEKEREARDRIAEVDRQNGVATHKPVISEDEAVHLIVKGMTGDDYGWSGSEITAYYKLAHTAYLALLPHLSKS